MKLDGGGIGNVRRRWSANGGRDGDDGALSTDDGNASSAPRENGRRSASANASVNVRGRSMRRRRDWYSRMWRRCPDASANGRAVRVSVDGGAADAADDGRRWIEMCTAIRIARRSFP